MRMQAQLSIQSLHGQVMTHHANLLHTDFVFSQNLRNFQELLKSLTWCMQSSDQVLPIVLGFITGVIILRLCFENDLEQRSPPELRGK